MCQKYIAEYGEVPEVFKQEDIDIDFYDKVESIINIINNFFWLPDADWQLIQRQIELLNLKFEPSKLEFSCKKIIKEMKIRCETY